VGILVAEGNIGRMWEDRKMMDVQKIKCSVLGKERDR
jgi:hypothetical protein